MDGQEYAIQKSDARLRKWKIALMIDYDLNAKAGRLGWQLSECLAVQLSLDDNLCGWQYVVAV